MYNAWDRKGMHKNFWWESQKERDHSEGLDEGGRIILKWIFKNENGMIWTTLIWFRIGTSGEPLWTRL
jgi:hypothetical protein